MFGLLFLTLPAFGPVIGHNPIPASEAMFGDLVNTEFMALSQAAICIDLPRSATSLRLLHILEEASRLVSWNEPCDKFLAASPWRPSFIEDQLSIMFPAVCFPRTWRRLASAPCGAQITSASIGVGPTRNAPEERLSVCRGHYNVVPSRIGDDPT